MSDARTTLDYLRSIDVAPVLMFHNIQPYTIQELLFHYHAHRLPEPRTVLEIVKYLVTSFPDRPDGKIDGWLIADPVGGPPPPKHDLFSASGRVTCDSCSAQVYRAVVSLRKTRDVGRFLSTYEDLTRCPCAARYYEAIRAQAPLNDDLRSRVAKMISLVDEKVQDYLSVIRPILNASEDYSVFDDSVAHVGADVSVPFPQLKAELLCQGMRIDSRIEADLVSFNSYVKEAGFVHASHFLVDGKAVNACVAERFCNSSPYLLTRHNGQYQLVKDGSAVCKCDVMCLPEWCLDSLDGTRAMGDVLRPHSGNVVSGMPDTRCSYFALGKGCAFCSLAPLQNVGPVAPGAVAEVALHALKYNPGYELALSGGTPATGDRGATYFAAIAEALHKRSNMPISVELVPPEDNCHLADLADAGVTSVIMNIEIWDQSLRAMFCPGKSEVAIERYLNAIEYAVGRFGRGQVASVLIAGLQSQEVLLDGAKEIIGRGAIPTVIPFKPFDSCRLASMPPAQPDEVVAAYRSVSYLLAANQLNPSLQKGCTGCGGCSLETLTYSE